MRLVYATGALTALLVAGAIVIAAAIVLLDEKRADPEGVVGVVPVPGSPDEAVIFLQGGYLLRGSFSDAVEPTLFGDISDRLSSSLSFEEGLLGVAFHPGYPGEPYIYLSYTAGEEYSERRDADDPKRNVVSRFEVREGAIDTDSESIVLAVPQPHGFHNGGHVVFGPDGYLYVGLGDGGGSGDPNRHGQDPSTPYGSILRIDGTPDPQVTSPIADILSGAPDNPFVGDPDALDAIFAYGFRNPWRYSFDRQTGELWVGDVGQNKWEEIDIVEAGGNYGWSCLEGLEQYNGDQCLGQPSTDPIFVYQHRGGVCGVIGGFVYRGSALTDLVGRFVYGDYCSGDIWALSPATAESTRIHETGSQISSFAELPDGELLVVTLNDGVYRLADELERIFIGLGDAIQEFAH